MQCRRTLKYTYVFAFYLPDATPEKNLFEWLQEELETTTEALSGRYQQMIHKNIYTYLFGGWNVECPMKMIAHSTYQPAKRYIHKDLYTNI